MTLPSDAFTRVAGSPAYAWNGVEIGTPVVFLHGFGDMAECWFGLVNRLQLQQPVYLLDAPGHGQSPVDHALHYIEHTVERAASFVRALQQPVLLVGHSMGALEAMYLAGDLADQVQGIVLEDPPMARDLTPWRDPALFAGLFGFLHSMRTQDFAEAVARARREKPHWDDIEYEPWVRSKQIVDVRVRDHFAIHREPMETTWGRIHCPVLLLTGAPARGAIIEADAAAWAQQQCPSLRVAHFPDASHDIRRDLAAAVAPVIRAFLAECSSGTVSDPTGTGVAQA